MRRLAIGIAIIMALLVVGYNPTEAREIRQGDQCVVGANETVQGNLYVLCRTLDIRGRVDGDVIGAATRVTITGTVDGDVYLAAGQLDFSGVIGEDLHFAGPALRILPTARFTSDRADLISLSLSTTIDDAVTLPGSITGVGYQMLVNGNVGREISFWGSALTLKGAIGGDVDATVGDPQSNGVSQLQTIIGLFGWNVELINPGLVMSQESKIEGRLSYTGPAEAAIDGTVVGSTFFTPIVTQPDLTQIISQDEGGGLGVFVGQVVHEFIILMLIGLIGLTFLPRQLQAPIRSIQSRSLPSLGVGLLAFIIAFPITIIVLGFILILIFVLLLLQLDTLAVGLVSGTLIGVWMGSTSMVFFVAIFISRIIVCLVLGRGIVRIVLGDDGSQRITFLSLFIGILVLSIVASLPAIGLILSAITAFLGFGAILNTLFKQVQLYRDRLYGPPSRLAPTMPTRRIDMARHLPPPIIDDAPKSPGADNLPEGFSWWGEE